MIPPIEVSPTSIEEGLVAIQATIGTLPCTCREVLCVRCLVFKMCGEMLEKIGKENR